MEETYIDSLDPEKLLQCPYDKNHQIRACRFPYHLIKCRKNHPDVANKLATCPFNARHQVPRAEISHHISSCDDKSCIEQDVVNQTRNLGQETLAESTWQCPPCDEDWDKDLWEQTSTPFVWGTANYCGNNSPASNIVMEHKSNLASGMRVPKSLPYVLPWKNSSDVTWLNTSGNQKIRFGPRRESATAALGCVRKAHADLDEWRTLKPSLTRLPRCLVLISSG
ncbi:gametocyte-specific factor 1 isoform X2 [Prionailurus iriomotensis]